MDKEEDDADEGAARKAVTGGRGRPLLHPHSAPRQVVPCLTGRCAARALRFLLAGRGALFCSRRRVSVGPYWNVWPPLRRLLGSLIAAQMSEELRSYRRAALETMQKVSRTFPSASSRCTDLAFGCFLQPQPSPSQSTGALREAPRDSPPRSPSSSAAVAPPSPPAPFGSGDGGG